MPRTVMTRSSRVRRALGHRRALPRGQADHVVWVYAITDGLTADQLAGLTGVGGERVRAVTQGGLTAVVGSVDASTFGEEARGKLLADLASIERLGRAHHQVIVCVAADGPVLPLRLATVYPDDDTVRTLLGRSSAEFAVMLESFRGTEEWGVKVYVGQEESARSDGNGGRSAAAGTGASGKAGNPPGAAGTGRARTSGSDAGTGRVAGAGKVPAVGEAPDASDDPGVGEAVCAELIDRALSGIAVATRRHPAADPQFEGPEKNLVLNAAYLLNTERSDEFAAVARALARVNDGVRADLTGPWPPYSFADLHQA